MNRSGGRALPLILLLLVLLAGAAGYGYWWVENMFTAPGPLAVTAVKIKFLFDNTIHSFGQGILAGSPLSVMEMAMCWAFNKSTYSLLQY